MVTYTSETAAVVGILKHTQEILDREGWIQGSLHSPNGYCLIGAIHKAARDLNTWHQDLDVAQLTLSRTLFNQIGHHSGVGSWNDNKFTTYADVQNLIAGAIERTIENA